MDRLAAKLFSIDGKRAVTLTEMSSAGAAMRVEAPPAAGSIAVVVRNGIRLCGTVAEPAANGFRLDFDHVVTGREFELFWGAVVEAVAPPETQCPLREDEDVSPTASLVAA